MIDATCPQCGYSFTLDQSHTTHTTTRKEISNVKNILPQREVSSTAHKLYCWCLSHAMDRKKDHGLIFQRLNMIWNSCSGKYLELELDKLKNELEKGA